MNRSRLAGARCLVAGAVLLALGLGACRPASQVPPGPTPVRQGLPTAGAAGLPHFRSVARRGEQAYAALCVACHGTAGRGDGPAAAALSPSPTNFLDAEYMADQQPAWYYRALTDGVTGSAMSGWDHQLDEATRWDTAYYVWSLAVSSTSRAAGAQDYAAHCARCHGADGAGVPGLRFDDPAWATVSRLALRRRIAARHPELVPDSASEQAAALADWLATFLYEPIDAAPP